MSLIRLQKVLADAGVASRRASEELILDGRVSVDGRVIRELGTKIDPINSLVQVDGEAISRVTTKSYIAFNKPTGITSTTDLKDKTNIITFINHPKRIFPIGRLDKDSEGLILLTNDGDIVNKILRDGNNHEKEYIVTVDNPLTQEAIMGMSKGVKMLGTTTKPCTIKQEGPKRFRIILTQGLNRQIRRMCAIYGYTVKSLKRVRIMHLHLDNLKTGAWRNLTTQEISLLEKQLSNSIK